MSESETTNASKWKVMKGKEGKVLNSLWISSHVILGTLRVKDGRIKYTYTFIETETKGIN